MRFRLLAVFALCALPGAAADSSAPCAIQTVAGAAPTQYGDPQPTVRPAELIPVYGPIAVGPSGAVYSASASQIFRISAGVIYTIGGVPNGIDSTGDGGPVAGAHFQSMNAIAVGPDESIYVSEGMRIRRVGPDGVVSAFAGTGQPGFSGDGGPATAARLQAVAGIAIDSSGTMYVADGGNYRIRKITTAGFISTIAGIGGGNAPPGDDGPATAAQFGQMGPVAVDGAGRIYAIDSARVRVIGSDGIIRAFVGAGSTRPVPTPIVAGDFPSILDVAADASNNFYFANGSYPFSVWKAPPGGTPLAIATNIPTSISLAADSAGGVYYASNGSLIRHPASGAEQLVAGGDSSGIADGVPATIVPLSPLGVTTDAQGNLYISDQRTQRVRRVGADGIIRTVVGGGKGGDGSPALSVSLDSPSRLAFDAQGNLFILCLDRVRKMSTDGIITTVAGGGQTSVPDDGVTATSVNFRFPRGIAVDAAGNLYVAETDRNRVWRVSTDGLIHRVAGTDKPASDTARDGFPATQLPVYSPISLAIDSAGTLLFVDGWGVRSIQSDGILRTITRMGNGPFPSFSAPGQTLAVDAQSNLYMGMDNRVLRIETNGYVRTVAGNYKSGFTGDGGPPENALLTFPQAQWGDAAGNLFVIDSSRVREIANVASCTAPAIPQLDYSSFSDPTTLDLGFTAPGKRITLKGVNLGPLATAMARPDASGYFPTDLAGSRVYVNGIAAPILSAQNNSVTFVTPYAAQTGTLQVQFQGYQSAPARVQVTPQLPELFLSAVPTAGSSPYGTAYALNEDGTQNSAANPAAAGQVVAIYFTGEGDTDPPGIDGKAAADPLPKPLAAPVVSLSKLDPGGSYFIPEVAEITFVGSFPGEIGKMQVNFRVPSGLRPGAALISVYRAVANIFVK